MVKVSAKLRIGKAKELVPASETPSEMELAAALGPAAELWIEVIKAIESVASPVTQLWRPSKSVFGRICLVQHRKRTLVYLTPDAGVITVAIVLGDRAFNLALASSLPEDVKQMFREAKPYTEGWGIRFPVSTSAELSTITTLVQIKTTPK